MCLNTDDKNKCLAKTDLIVYKTLGKFHKDFCIPFYYRSHVYITNELQPNVKIKAYQGIGPKQYYVEKGYHFYINHEKDIFKLLKNVDKIGVFKIPSGTWYIKDGNYQLVAETAIYLGSYWRYKLSQIKNKIKNLFK